MARPGPVDAVALAQALIRCPSVTPEDGGALAVLARALEGLGFRCHRLPFADAGTAKVENLFARYGAATPHFCFAGHTDVVPAGDRMAWTVEPFAGDIRDGRLIGRGASDMKGAIAAFVAATATFFLQHGARLDGSISLLITGDEEGPAINGTRKVLDWMKAHGELPDHCLVGEPTNPKAVGDMIKIGRRGSLNARLTVEGVQGHAAYPQLAENPIPKLVDILARLAAHRLDEGTEGFDPSNLEITTIDVGNRAANVIPARATALVNIRFNPLHTASSLETWLRSQCDAVMNGRGGRYALDIEVSGEAFLTPSGPFIDLVRAAVRKSTGREPVLSTSGGTSDARFIKDVCPVAEFGLISDTMHKVDESVPVTAIATLTDIYINVLESYFAK